MQVTRLPVNPIVRPQMDARMGDNVNGPSLIRVPDWVAAPLGRYYLYFAHHDGAYIRLAYADHLEGPWRTHEAGVLPLARSGFKGHIASPDVHVDHSERRIRMYFHGCDAGTGTSDPQYTRVAVSEDGLAFTARGENLGRAYFRVFRFRASYYALQMPGRLLRSTDPLTGFEPGPTLFTANMRHSAVAVRGQHLCVLYTNVGDAPEAIVQAWIDLRGPWQAWQPSAPRPVLAPARDYEGLDAPLRPSVRGIVDGPVRELRDPALYLEDDTAFLLYSVAGEQGIAIARVDDWGEPPREPARG